VRCVIKIPIHIRAQDGIIGQFRRRNLRRTWVEHTGNFVLRRKLLEAQSVRVKKTDSFDKPFMFHYRCFLPFLSGSVTQLWGTQGHYGALCCLSSLQVGLNGAFRGTLTDSDQNCGALWGLLDSNRATVKIATLCDELRHSGSSQPQGRYGIGKIVQKGRSGPLYVGGQIGRQTRTITRRGTCQ